MTRSLPCVFLAVAMLLCTSASAESEPKARPATWLEQIHAGAKGKDAAIVCDANGVWAFAPEWKLPISAQVANWCVADGFADVVWMQFGKELHVLDLAGTSAKTRVVLTGWPSDAGHGEGAPAPVVVAHGNSRVGNASHNGAFHVFLRVEDASATLGLDNFSYTVEDADLKKIEKRIQVRDRKLLKRLAARAKDRARPVPVSACPSKIKGLPTDACEDGECGLAAPIAGTTYCRVLVGQTCGDGCYLSFAFYDTKTSAWLYGFKPGAETHAAPFPDAAALAVSPSGSHVIVGGAILDWKKRILPKGAAGWVGIGQWLHGE